MLAYAANRTGTARRHPSPPAMLVIAAAHIAAIALVMSAKMDLPDRKGPGTDVIFVPLPPSPKPPEPQPQVQPQTQPSVVDRIPAVVPIPQPDLEPLDARLVLLPPLGRDLIGPPVIPQPRADPLPLPKTVRVGPRFVTPDNALRPPYPRSRLDSGEEASLWLRLSIDPRGRVTAVEPVGRADPAFLEAARRHLIARWRYKPATEDGRPVASSTVITLRFELEG